jgi:hypothetical protein
MHMRGTTIEKEVEIYATNLANKPSSESDMGCPVIEVSNF